MYHVLITRMHMSAFVLRPYKSHKSPLTNMVCVSPPSSLFLLLPPYRPGDGCIAKWSRSSCITEDTAGTVTTASPAPAVTRSCLMEPVLSWTSTPLKMTTSWMGMLPPQVGMTGSTGYQMAPQPFIVITQTLIVPDLLHSLTVQRASPLGRTMQTRWLSADESLGSGLTSLDVPHHFFVTPRTRLLPFGMTQTHMMRSSSAQSLVVALLFCD